MLGKRRKERMKENAASASALALELAQDKRFRKRLLSAIEHGSEAGRRTRRGLGLRGTVRGLATDEALLRELRSARSDLQHAYGRLEAKRRTHKLRNVLLLAALGSVAGVPQLRARLGAVFEKASKHRQRPPGVGNSGTRSPSDKSQAPPHRLEDLSKEELYARAQEADIPGRSEMTKEQLVEALRARS
jgi:hypothetical protein